MLYICILYNLLAHGGQWRIYCATIAQYFLTIQVYKYACLNEQHIRKTTHESSSVTLYKLYSIISVWLPCVAVLSARSLFLLDSRKHFQYMYILISIFPDPSRHKLHTCDILSATLCIKSMHNLHKHSVFGFVLL